MRPFWRIAVIETRIGLVGEQGRPPFDQVHHVQLEPIFPRRAALRGMALEHIGESIYGLSELIHRAGRGGLTLADIPHGFGRLLASAEAARLSEGRPAARREGRGQDGRAEDLEAGHRHGVRPPGV
jgi:hypothetical protein